jgi:hypothetical protein
MAAVSLVAEQGSVSRGDLVRQVFGVDVSELDELVEAGLLTVIEDRRGRLLVTAASPRLRNAMQTTLRDVGVLALLDSLEKGVAKAEASKRAKQLASRRLGQAATARALAGVVGDGAELDGAQTPATRELSCVIDEMHSLGEEQRAVWQAYDVLKWEGRWRKAQDDGAPQ